MVGGVAAGRLGALVAANSFAGSASGECLAEPVSQHPKREESTMNIGRIGIWTFALDLQPAARAQEAAAEIEALGYGAIWVPEALGREAFTNAALLLAGTKRIVVATGIANIWGRDAMAM